MSRWDANSDLECACGCGRLLGAPLRPDRPARFIAGHHHRLRKPSPGKYKVSSAYGEPATYVHRARAERALGRELPPGAEVHHADGSKSEHAPLVICQDRAYHMLLHRRMRIRTAGGDPNTQRLCCTCKTLKLIAVMCKPHADGRERPECKACNAARSRERERRRKAEANESMGRVQL